MTKTYPAQILVGIGESAGFSDTLDWAAREAQLRGRALHAVRVWDIPSAVTPWDVTADSVVRDHLRTEAEHGMHDAVTHLNEKWPDVQVRTDVVEGTTWHVLAHRGADSELTVVGAHHGGSVRPMILGSVGAAVAAHAQGPVIAVHAQPEAAEPDRAVVVGIDGAPGNADVLAFAFDFASRHGRPVHALYCFSPDLIASSPWRTRQPFAEQADRWLAEVLAGWQERYPDVQVRREVIREHPVPALVSAADGQQLLVVGASSAHNRIGSLLGSVTQSVLHHAACSVAVVPSGSRQE